MASTEQQLSLFVSDEVPVAAQPESQCVAPFIRDSDVIPVAGVHDLDWAQFFQERGRIPMICDDKKPWEYRGWLMYYRVLLEDTGQVGYRWDYWMRTIVAGQLLDEKIPQLCFSGEDDKSKGMKLVEDWVRLVDRDHGGWSAIGRLFDWLLWGFGLIPEAPGLSRKLNEELYRKVDLSPLLIRPYDYFGEWIAMNKGRWNPHAFFPTPHTLAEAMVRMNMDTGEDMRAKTVCDPAVGSGRMLLHASNFSLRLYGMDIDAELVKLTKINGALYVPWLVRPFPDFFFGQGGA